jgi:hypothetical protein
MDKVKLGRALGYGARHAARAAMQAMDAATAPDPRPATPSTATRTASATSSSASQPPPRAANSAQAADRIAQAQRTVQATTEQARAAGRQAKVAGRHAKAVGRSVWSPLARFSGVLWLQVTGSIYGLIALTLGQAVWVHRSAIHLAPSAKPAQQLYLLIAALILFAYFCLSAFIRAARR